MKGNQFPILMDPPLSLSLSLSLERVAQPVKYIYNTAIFKGVLLLSLALSLSIHSVHRAPADSFRVKTHTHTEKRREKDRPYSAQNDAGT